MRILFFASSIIRLLENLQFIFENFSKKEQKQIQHLIEEIYEETFERRQPTFTKKSQQQSQQFQPSKRAPKLNLFTSINSLPLREHQSLRKPDSIKYVNPEKYYQLSEKFNQQPEQISHKQQKQTLYQKYEQLSYRNNQPQHQKYFQPASQLAKRPLPPWNPNRNPPPPRNPYLNSSPPTNPSLNPPPPPINPYQNRSPSPIISYQYPDQTSLSKNPPRNIKSKLTNIARLYTKNVKYNKKNDNFDYKLQIFHDIYNQTKVSMKKKQRQVFSCLKN